MDICNVPISNLPTDAEEQFLGGAADVD